MVIHSGAGFDFDSFRQAQEVRRRNQIELTQTDVVDPYTPIHRRYSINITYIF